MTKLRQLDKRMVGSCLAVFHPQSWQFTRYDPLRTGPQGNGMTECKGECGIFEL